MYVKRHNVNVNVLYTLFRLLVLDSCYLVSSYYECSVFSALMLLVG